MDLLKGIFEKAKKCWPKIPVSVNLYIDGSVSILDTTKSYQYTIIDAFDSLQDLEAQLDKKLEAMKPKEEWVLLANGEIMSSYNLAKETVELFRLQGNSFPSEALGERERDRRALLAEMWKMEGAEEFENGRVQWNFQLYKGLVENIMYDDINPLSLFPWFPSRKLRDAAIKEHEKEILKLWTEKQNLERGIRN